MDKRIFLKLAKIFHIFQKKCELWADNSTDLKIRDIKKELKTLKTLLQKNPLKNNDILDEYYLKLIGIDEEHKKLESFIKIEGDGS